MSPGSSLRRLHLCSTRARLTVLAMATAIVMLVPMGMVGASAATQASADPSWSGAREQAGITAAAAERRNLSGLIETQTPGIDLIQVVGADHRVIAASPAARGRDPLSQVRPSPDHLQADVEVCPKNADGQCLRLTAVRLSPAPTSPVVYAGRMVSPAPSRTFRALWTAHIALLILLATAATWKMTSRMLGPIQLMRAQLAAINVSDLSTRIPQPPGRGEIAQLAHTINHTLGRLEQAKSSTEQALQRQRQFASDASHELRTPLAGLRVRLEEAQMHPRDTELPDLIGHALEDLDRVQAIMTDLLLLARLGATAPQATQHVDLTTLIRTETSRRADRHPIALDLADRVVVDAVPGQIARVLTNLLDNAQRHATSQVRVRLRHSATHAELAVSDDGDGVPPADRERIFQRFVRLDAARSRDRGGTGLGLAIARDIATAHHGTLHVEQAAIGGAGFILRLPLSTPAEQTGP
ncbi:HAMP domain-containing sensor histidine kinase [Nonomuraea sp. NPDC000554]|uniref:sensor histidine kinase n=1 Tax=Nonomuraea sp. NPDC000554 TaxID=3154259 RepID=UPI00331A99A8